MSIEESPYVGTWRLNQKQVVRHTPDALVYVNGDTSIPGCPNCNGRLDLQKYITQVSVDPSTQPPASASISLHVPRQAAQNLWRDGAFILHPGLEINIYMRGYFPVKGLLSNVSAEETGGLDPSKAMSYPYYHVFHGVVTEVSHEYSGSDHTATLNCADLLHFWQYIRMSTNASYLGARPSNSKNRMSFVGHNFTGMTPYGIVYGLWRDIFGAAGGAEYATSNVTNAAANNTAISESQYSQTVLYWQKRFGETMASLRMHGVDGTLFNAFQQTYLGKLTTKEADTMLSAKYADKSSQGTREVAPFILDAQSLVWGQDVPPGKDGTGAAGISSTSMQAFVFDPGQIGANIYESQYQTKMEILSTVTEMTGYEFYQDVDGDFVFKPPFYNLDTSSSRTYVIKPIDLISFSAREGEPEATVVKCTGTVGRNIKQAVGEGVGHRAEYIDYRLVAQFGWRQQTFESEYHGNSRAMYYACINRMDMFNIGVNSASCSIPLRPELRPGMPVYIEHIDCFYYLQAFNHSFSYGGQCTTSMTLVGKRAKFHAPGKPPLDRVANLDDIDLSNPFLPKLPLQVEGFDGIPRLQGFPNVVLALDPTQLNPLFYVVGSAFTFGSGSLGGGTADDPREQLRALITVAIANGVITHDGENQVPSATGTVREAFFEGPFKIQIADGSFSSLPEADLLTQLTTVTAALAEVQAAETATGEDFSENTLTEAQATLAAANTAATELNTLITAVRSSASDSFPDADSTGAYLDVLSDLKSSFSPGRALPGYYRYYSASHPTAGQQGQAEIIATEEGGTQSAGTTQLERAENVFGFTVSAGEGAAITDPRSGGGVSVTAGIPIIGTGTKDVVPTPTNKIQTISFARHTLNKRTIKLGRSGLKQLNFSRSTTQAPMQRTLSQQLAALTYDASTEVSELFEAFYTERVGPRASEEEPYTLSDAASDLSVSSIQLQSFAEALSTLRRGVPNTPDAQIGGDDENQTVVRQNVTQIARHLTKVLAEQAAAILCAAEAPLIEQFGHRGQKTSEGTDEEAKEEAFCKLEIAWDRLKEALAPGEVSNGDGGTPVKTVVEIDNEKPFYSPVFPVSDERGYEVIGSYRYGRGLSIEPGGSFERLLDLRDLSFDELSASEADALVEALQNGGDIAKVVGTFDPDRQAELCSLLEVQTEGGVESYLNSKPGQDSFNSAFTARLASTQDWTQKQTIVNSAYSLADIQETLNENEICNCKGADADLFFLAFNNQNFVDLGQPDDVSNYVANLHLEQYVPSKAVQDAVRGHTMDRSALGTFSSAGRSVGGAADAFSGGLFNAFGQGISNAGSVDLFPDDEGG